MKKAISFFGLLLVWASLSAQQIRKAEYYIDSDPGQGNGTPISTGALSDSINQIVNIPILSSIGTGIHRLVIRPQDDKGRWGLGMSQYFYLVPGSFIQSVATAPIQAVEYYIDADPGNGNGIALASGGNPDSVNTVYNISIPPTTSTGIHRIVFRTKDALGRWSLGMSQYFYLVPGSFIQSVASAPIQAVEYYIDADPGNGNGIALASGSNPDSVNTVYNINIPPTTSTGIHRIVFRTKDALGRWSLGMSQYFYLVPSSFIQSVASAPIQGVEYFIDADPGNGNGIALASGGNPDSVNTIFNINIPPTTSTGIHRIVFRTKDELGRWSLGMSQYFYLIPNVLLQQTTSQPIVAAEYFINKNDPGVGKGIPFSIGAATDSLDQVFALNISSSLLSAPRDTITIRVKDALGRWSFHRSDTIRVQEPESNDNCSAAQFITDFSNCNSTIYSSAGATQSTLPIVCNGFMSSSAKDVWFKFTKVVGVDSLVIVPVSAGDDPVIEIFSGNCSALNSISCSDLEAGQKEYIPLNGLTNGTTYYFRVYGWNGATVNFHIRKTRSTPVGINATITSSGPLSFCDGGSVTLTASPGSQYLWTPGGQTTQGITVLTGGTYIVRITNASGCQDTASKVVTVPNGAGASISASGPNIFCAGSSVVLTSSTGQSYLWSPSGETTKAIAATSSGTYIVTVTYPGGCTSQAQQIVTVNSTPTVSITPSGPTTFCIGQNITLTASAGQSYQWTPGGQTSQVITITQSGTYTARVFNAQGCSATASQVVTVTNNVPVSITTSGPTTFCNGDSVVLTASGANTYSWSPGGTTTASIKVKTGGNYTVTGTSSGCTGTASQSVTVTTPSTPTISASGPLAFCSGGSVTLTSSSSTGNLWSNGATSQSIVVTSSGSFFVKRTDANGCVSGNSSTTTVTVNPVQPTPTVSASGPLAFCQGGNVVLTSSAGSGNTWSNGATSQSITVGNSGTFVVSVGAAGCISTSASLVVAVTPSTKGTFAAIPAFCSGTAAPLLPLVSTNGISGTWNPASVSNTTSGNYVFTPSSGSCIVTTNLMVTVTQIATPLFAAIGPIASGSTPPNLSTSSQNGFTGTWNPATINNSQTTTYTFTPNANQCATSTTLTVVVNTYPDVAVQNVTSPTTDKAPGDVVPLSWTVANVGTAPAPVNWTERIYIQTPTGQNRTQLKQTVYTTAEIIGLGQTISRSDNITLPAQVTVGDQAVFVVEIISGNTLTEAPGTIANNTGVQSALWNIRKTFTLQLSSTQITEGSGSGISVTVSRSGSVGGTQAFDIALNPANRFSFPSSLTFQTGQVSRTFTLLALNNSQIEANIAATLSASASGFETATTNLTILEDDKPSLSISGLPDTTGEGVVLNFQVQTNLAPVSPLTVYLTSNNSTRFPVPASVTIPAGQLSASGSINLVQDNTPEINTNVSLTAGASNHNSASKTIHLTDNDIPGIELVFQTKTVSESQGYYATQATLRRIPGGNPIAFSVNLSSNLSNTLILPSSVPLAANEISKTFTIGVIDDGLVNGARNVTVGASLFVSSCGCNAPNTTAGYFEDTLRVLDNDGPTLTLSTPVLTLAEGQANAAILKITRNTPTGSPLVVNLSSSNTGEATVPNSVTIPAGSNFVEVPITTINDNQTDGSKQINLSATSAGFTQGTLWVIVTDINKPDLVLQNVIVGSSSVEAKTIFTYSFKIANTGFAHNPAGVRVNGYLSKDDFLDSSDSLIINDQIIDPILTTQPNEFVNAVQAPNRPGTYKLIFKVNPESGFSELNYNNNTSVPIALNIIPEYDATAKVDSVWFLRGSPIEIKGKATRTNGMDAGNIPVDVYVVTSNGLRRTYNSQTDAKGNYSYLFQPISNEVGSYTVGACFPGFGDETTDDSFDILGVRINNGNLPQFKTTLGDTIKGKLPIVNLCGFPIKDVGLSPTNLPVGAHFQFGKVATLNPGIRDSISYKAWGNSVTVGNNFVATSFQVTSAKGNIQQQDAFFYCQAQQAFISSSLNFIDVKISASAGQKLVQFKLTNLGQGNSGQVRINLPQNNWLAALTPTTINNLGSGDTSTIILRFSALPEVPFEFPIVGSIGIQVANGNNFSIPFSFEKVSQTSGVVAIEVTNQFTYYAAGSPKVAEANVKIRNYYTGELYGQGKTDSSGRIFFLNVPEGVHRISVDKERHLGYTGTISIVPGDTIRKSVFINYQAITFNWNVEPTVIQDQYDITLTATFETNIPMPVVVLDMPKTMPNLQGDQEFAFMATLINHGLITAKDVKLNLPQSDPEYEFVTNYSQSDLSALQSIQVPVIMKRRQNQGLIVSGKASIGEISSFLGIGSPNFISNTSGLPCQDFTNYVYWYKCGLDGIWQQGGVLFTYTGRSCGGGGGGGGGGSGGGGLCWSCIGGGISYPPCVNCPPPPPQGNGNTPPPVETEKKNCKQCINDLAQATAGCLDIDIPPDVKCFADGFANGTGPKEYVTCLAKENTIGRLEGIGDEIIGKIPYIGPAYTAYSCIKDLLEALETCQNSLDNNGGGGVVGAAIAASNENSLVSELYSNLTKVRDGYLLRDKWSREYFGDLPENNSWYQFYVQIAPYIDSLDQIPAQKQDSIIQLMIGYEVPIIQLQNFFVRWNQSITARDLDVLSPNAQYPNIINWIRIKEISDSLVVAHNFAISKGFSGISGMHVNVNETVDSLTKPQNQSVCASVKVQFSQTLTMTREAFRGTLDIFNGHPTDKMDSLSVNILVTDANGVPSNGVFQINTEQLTNLSDVTGTGKINAQQSGTAKFLFIPELGAAPTVPKIYNFGGSVRYFDPYARAMVTLPLNAVSLTVNPSPNLQLHYFMQRDILGDDALTSPKIEPSIPAELAVMVENWGYGPAVNMTISSAEPKIVENEKGLAINFKLIGSNFQGKPRQLGVTNINFGTLPPLKTRIGEWYFTSTLLGKFVSYEANVVHANSFGNPDLSLVKGIKLHELTKSVRVYGTQDDTIGDFLANDVPDIGNTPDILYLSQGKQTSEVFVADSGSFNIQVGAPSFTNILTVISSDTGWNYIKINDPGDNRYNIQSITRSDGQKIPLENAWLTFVTLPAAQAPIYENKFQFVDKFPSATTQTYTVVWGPKNNNVPEVDSIIGTPVNVTSVQVSLVRVKFSKAINPTTFNWQDLDLVFQGGPNIANNSITVTQVDTATFDLDLSNVTTGNGTYKLVVQAAEVEDVYGIAGLSGKQVIWTQYLNVPVVQAFEGIPASKRSKSFDSVYVIFNLPMDTLSLTSGRFQIKKNNIIQPGTIVVSKADTLQKRFLLTGIDAIMTTDGQYSLVVDLPQIKSKTQVFGLAEQSVVLTLDRTGPLLTSFTKSNTGGLDNQHYPNFNLVFNEALTGFNVAAFQLTRNGDNVTIPLDKLSSSDQKTWTIGTLGLLTYPEGNYVFKVNLSNAKDDLGNAGTGTQELNWTVNRSIPFAITDLKINPDQGFSNADGISSDLAFNVNFMLGSAASEVKISQTNVGGETLLTTLTNLAAGPVVVPVNLLSGGNTGIKVSAIGTDGGTGSATINLFLDQQPLTAKWTNAPSSTIFRQVDSVNLVFNTRLLTPASVLSALQFQKDGTPVSGPGLVVQPVNDTLYMVRGLRSLATNPGNFQLAVNLTTLRKYTSGAKGNANLVQNWKVERANQAPVANAGSDLVISQEGQVNLNASNSTDPDVDLLSYTWIAPEGVALNNSSAANPNFQVSLSDNGKNFAFLVIVKDGAGLFSTDVVNVSVKIDTAGLSFSGLGAQYCVNEETSSLVGSPSGGIFSGPGISGNSFNPAAAGEGTHTIVYSKDGQSTSQNVTVNALTLPLFASVGPICSGTTAPVLPTTSTNGISGTWNPAIVSNTATGTYVFTPMAGLCATTESISVTVTPLVTPTFAAIDPICSGATPPILPTPSTNGFSGTWNPAIVSNTATGTYVFTPTAGLCATTASVSVTVNPLVTPVFAAIGPICSGVTPPILPTASTNGISGIWNPATVSNTASGTYVFTPTAGQCATSASVSVTVSPLPTIAITTPVSCSVDLLTWSLGVTVSSGNVTSTAGSVLNTSGNLWTISGIPTGTNITISVTTTCLNTIVVSSPNCNCPAVNAPVSTGNKSYCQGSAIPSISATVLAGETVDWYSVSSGGSPLGSSSTSFTPGAPGTYFAQARIIASGCLSSTRTAVSVTVTPNVTPTFAAIGPICSGVTSPILPTTSTNGISGTWNPATVSNTATGTYIFTPTAGLCATTASVSVTVTPKVTPIFAAIGPICSGATPPILPATSTNGISGTWNPSTVSNTASGTYVFTPTAGLCATTASVSVTVTPLVTLVFAAFGPICSDAIPPILPATSTNGISGTWNPATVSNTATGTYVFTPNAGQCATAASISVTVIPNLTPNFAAIGPICSGTTSPILPTTSTNGISGTWNPATVSNTATSTYQFTPNIGQCATTASITIIVKPQLNFGTLVFDNQFFSQSGDPSNIAFETLPIGGSGEFEYQWYFQNGIQSAPVGSSTTGWTAIPGATGAEYDPPITSSSISFAVQVKSIGNPACGSTNWANGVRQISIEVLGFDPGILQNANQTLCYNAAPALIAFIQAASGGSTFQWYYKDGLQAAPANNSSVNDWIIIPGANAASYDPASGLTQSRTFACRVSKGSESLWASSVRQITVLPRFNPGIISAGDQTFCGSGNPANITLSSIPVGSGAFQWRWYFRDNTTGDCPSGNSIPVGWNTNNTSVNVTGTTLDGTGISFDPSTAGNVNTGKSFAVLITPLPNGNIPACGVPLWASSCRKTFVIPCASFNPGQLSAGDQTICYGADPSEISLEVQATAGSSNQWYYKDGIVSAPSFNDPLTGWTAIGGASGSVYNPPVGLVSTRTYACRSTLSAISQWAVGVRLVTVLPEFKPGAILSGDQTFCNSGNPANITLSQNPSGSGAYLWRWYYRESSTGDCPIGSTVPAGWLTNNTKGITGTSPNGSGISYDPQSAGTLGNGRTFSLFITPIANGNTPACGLPTWASSCRKTIVNLCPDFNPGIISGGEETICNAGDPSVINFSLVPSNGSVYRWYFKTGIVAAPLATDPITGWTAIQGVTSPSYNPPAGLTTSRTYACRVSKGSEAQWASGIKQVIVLNIFSPGIITNADETFCNTGNPSKITLSQNPVGSGAYQYRWYFRETTTGDCPTGAVIPSGWLTNNTSVNIAGTSTDGTGMTFDPSTAGLVNKGRSFALLITPIANGNIPACGLPQWAASCRKTFVIPCSGFNAGTIATGNQTICNAGDPANIHLSLVPTSGSAIKWYYQDGLINAPAASDPITGWTLINGATTLSYDPPSGLLQSRTYACRVSKGLDNQWATGIRQVTVLSPVLPGTITSGDQTFCNSGNPAMITLSVNPAGSGAYQWRWYYQENSAITCPTGSTVPAGWLTNSSAPNITGTTKTGAGISYDPQSAGLAPSGRTFGVFITPIANGTAPVCGVPQWATSCRKTFVSNCQAALISGVTSDLDKVEKESISPWLFPNPTHDQVSVYFGEGQSKLRVINMLGVELINKEIDSGDEISLKLYPPGIYLFRIYRKDLVKEIKVVKQY